MTDPTRRRSRVEEVRAGLLAELLDGRLAPGDKLPNEDDLAGRFGVSRATVRDGVRGLLEAGYLVRRHGSGTFVTATPRSRHALDTTVSYTAMIREAGHEPGERVLGRATRAPTGEEALRLCLGDGEDVVEIERVRLADARPVIYSRDCLPAALVAGIEEVRLDASLYAILAWAGVPVERATARLTPTVASAGLARALEIKRGTPLLHVDQVDLAHDGRPVLRSLEWHVPDAFELIVNRRAAPGG